MAVTASRTQVLRFRIRAQQLHRDSGTLGDTAVLDIGVQDTGPDGGLWALVNRGVDVSALPDDDLATVWTIRGAPHLYLRSALPPVAAAVQPYSDGDAGKRIYDASTPLRAAGIANLTALDEVAQQMRSVVTRPTVKGEVSTELAARMSEPYLRFCRPCNATHLYEMPFRLAALRAGLELQAGTSPPVLQRIPGFRRDSRRSPRHDVIRAYLRLLGPATPQQAAGYLDAPVKDVRRTGRRTSWRSRSRGRGGGCCRPTPSASTSRLRARSGCWVRSTCSCRHGTGRCWCLAQAGPRSCGRCSAGPVQSLPTVRWPACGVPASRAGGFASR